MYPNKGAQNAPEVVPPSDLIHVPNYTDSPEVLRPTSSRSPPDVKGSSSAASGGGSYSDGNDTLPLHNAQAEEETPARKPASRWRRKRNLWLMFAAVVVAIGVGVGVGVGMGSQEAEDKRNGQSEESAASATNATSSTSPTATATATTSAVTSGSTGVAQFSCSGGETTTSSSGTPYIQECYTMYPAAADSYYSDTNNVTMKNLGGKNTVYSVEACLDACDEYNSEGNVPACRAISYYANLTAPIDLFGGNCFLKNDRGVGRNVDAVDWHHTLSAWQSCLNETCSGEN
ncbi:uncharacterized protein RCC_12035 [Ramularia collo-cygni]|uniref:Apple domain-containing protein n=1 Tax=Ramularia collo-cygni TaxID=112498 RepID=A0A2D3USJ1_9PEZI|nr:uncharacterized protein RCC_12035 [Ramularia collo-cygni]CZT15640.1 uncharacterized protein RCC_12035 [Ramularia collo-cygni]